MIKDLEFKPEDFESYINSSFDEVIKLTDFKKGGNLYYAREYHCFPHPYADYDVEHYTHHLISDLGASLGFYKVNDVFLRGEVICGGYENVSGIKNIENMSRKYLSQKKKFEEELNKSNGKRNEEKYQKMLNKARTEYFNELSDALAGIIANGDGLSKYIPDGIYIECPDFNKMVIKAKIKLIEEKKTPKDHKQYLEKELKKIDENFEKVYKQKGEDE